MYLSRLSRLMIVKSSNGNAPIHCSQRTLTWARRLPSVARQKERFGDQQRNLTPISAASRVEAALFDDSKKYRVEWLNPIAMSQLQAAVKTRKKYVFLNGDKFTITYGQWYRSKLTEDYEC